MKDIKNILLYNSGGGLGDSLMMIPLIKWLSDYYKLKKIYYIQNGIEKHFDNKLIDFKSCRIETIKNLPQDFGFFTIKRFSNYFHFKLAKKIPQMMNLEKFDLIIDTQTRVLNTLVFKSIPHRYFISATSSYFLSNPKFYFSPKKHVIERIFKYFEKILDQNIQIPTKLNDEDYSCINIENLFNKNKKYVGFAITAGHPFRKRQIPTRCVIEVANFLESKNLVPTFFIEEKYKDIINEIKKNVKNAFFPELQINKKNRTPYLVTKMGNELDFALSINGGIMHMLSFSKTKLLIFIDKRNLDKFIPLDKNKVFVFELKPNQQLDEINTGEILNSIKANFLIN